MKGGKKDNIDHKNQRHKSKFKKYKGRSNADRKKSKQILKEKRARLIIKNLSFKATEENVREFFQAHGDISNVELLRRPDGKLVGCAFVQFTLVQFAKKAQHYLNNQPFLGRNIQVDFAKPKDVYNKQKKLEKIKQEKEESSNVEIKEEIDLTVIKDEEDADVKQLNPTEMAVDSENVSNSEADSSESEEDHEDDNASQVPENSNEKKPFMSNDVTEGRTIFIKNVPFEATNEDLKQCMSQFGRLFYALICIDKMTEHSKGTAFVKFVNKEDTEKALSAGTELTLLGNVLDCHLALDRNELGKKIQNEKDMKSKPKDSRNLYLVKEGVILAGSKAAEGVSASDMAKRLQIEQYKTQMLRNLNTFVSKDRLVVHNLPPKWDDRKFKMLFQQHGGKGALVREARIMRNMKHVDAKGTGDSKQYGFVAFTQHEHALAALRSLNNNPNIFSSQKRPIIAFSIESKSALNAKLKRQQKSKLKNPKSKEYDPTSVKHELNQTNANTSEEVKPFTGVTAKEGVVQKMRSRYKLNVQAKLHYENVKKEKRKQKMVKKTLSERKKDFTKQPRQKINNKSQDDNFSKLVNDYKKMLTGDDIVKKSKWYE